MPLIEVVKAMLQRPVAYQPILARICGSATAGLMLSQAVYWSERTQDAEGWFYKKQEEWQQEICLTRYEQDTARKRLRALGFWKEKKKGVPCTTHFRVDMEALAACISQFVGNQQTGLLETTKLDCGKAANQPAGNQQTGLLETSKLLKEAEITAETTAEIEVIEKTVALFPLKDSAESYQVKALQVDRWQKQFPKIEVKTEILAMAAWLEANPERRKTRIGVPRFVVNWLKGEQGKLTGAPGGQRRARSRRPGGLLPLAAAADYAGGMTANQDGTYKL